MKRSTKSEMWRAGLMPLDLSTYNGAPEGAQRSVMKEIRRCVIEFLEKHGDRPTVRSGNECLPKGWTWGAVSYELMYTSYISLKALVERIEKEQAKKRGEG